MPTLSAESLVTVYALPRNGFTAFKMHCQQRSWFPVSHTETPTIVTHPNTSLYCIDVYSLPWDWVNSCGKSNQYIFLGSWWAIILDIEVLSSKEPHYEEEVLATWCQKSMCKDRKQEKEGDGSTLWQVFQAHTWTYFFINYHQCRFSITEFYRSHHVSCICLRNVVVFVYHFCMLNIDGT